jgi:cell division septation protein DedD
LEAPIETPVETNVENLDAYASLYAFASHFATTRGNIVFPKRPVEAITPAEAAPSVTETTAENPAPVNVTPNKSSFENLFSTEGVEKGYYVIGGVFCKERNAKRFIRQLANAGFTEAAMLVNTDINCKRVSYHRFDTRKDAELFCKDIKKEGNPDAWVLAAE